MIDTITVESLFKTQEEDTLENISDATLEDIKFEVSDILSEIASNECEINSFESEFVVLETSSCQTKLLDLGKKLVETIKRILKFLIKALTTLYELVTVPVRLIRNLIISKKLDKAIHMLKYVHEKRMMKIDDMFNDCVEARRVIERQKAEKVQLEMIDNHLNAGEMLCEYLESLSDSPDNQFEDYQPPVMTEELSEKIKKAVEEARQDPVDRIMNIGTWSYTYDEWKEHLKTLITYKGLDPEKHAIETRRRIKECQKMSERIARLINKKQIALNYISSEDRSMIMQLITIYQRDVASLESCTVDDVQDIQSLGTWADNFINYLDNLQDADIAIELKKAV